MLIDLTTNPPELHSELHSRSLVIRTKPFPKPTVVMSGVRLLRLNARYEVEEVSLHLSREYSIGCSEPVYHRFILMESTDHPESWAVEYHRRETYKGPPGSTELNVRSSLWVSLPGFDPSVVPGRREDPGSTFWEALTE